MPLSADDFTRMAGVAADALASKGTPLVETIDQLASDNSMTLEQIKRLCEAANNAAFKALFDKSDPSDREVNFPVARAEDVIARRRSKNVNTTEKKASFDEMAELKPLNYTRAAHDSAVQRFRDGTTWNDVSAFSKVASAPVEPYVDPVEQKALEKTAAQAAYNRSLEVARLREHLESECASTRYKIGSAVTEIATHFRRLGPDWAPHALDLFEKNAMAVHGESCVPILESVRNALPYGPFKGNVKEASFHVVTDRSGVLPMKVAQATADLERNRRANALLAQPGALEAAVNGQYEKTAGVYGRYHALQSIPDSVEKAAAVKMHLEAAHAAAQTHALRAEPHGVRQAAVDAAHKASQAANEAVNAALVAHGKAPHEFPPGL